MKILIIVILLSASFGVYNVGQTISIRDQNVTLEGCATNSDYYQQPYKLSDWNGTLNGGEYKVIWLEMSASWWPSCYSSIGTMDNIHDQWDEVEAVAMALELSDPGQPYSCASWGNNFNDSEIYLQPFT